MRKISYFAALMILTPLRLVAQTAVFAGPVPPQAAVYGRSGQTRGETAQAPAPVNLSLDLRVGLALYERSDFSAGRPRGRDETATLSPSIARLEPIECQKIGLNYLSSALLCPPGGQSDRISQGLTPGLSHALGAAFVRGQPDPPIYLFGGGQPVPGEQPVARPEWLVDLAPTGFTSPPMRQATAPALDPKAPGSEKRNDRAFLQVAASPEGRRHARRDKVAPIILSLAVHAAVTWDAQSTNHFFHHCPNGFRPAELDPLMRPFAGNALMYPMANLLFAAPADLLLRKTRHSQKPIRILTYAAASAWIGLEINQSIANLRNEGLQAAPVMESAKVIARMR